MKRYAISIKKIVLMACLAQVWCFAAALATPGSGITYHGRILNPDGTPLQGAAVQFQMQIRSPGAESCLLYQEVQTIDMSGANGVFSITINDGSGTRTDTGPYQFDTVFSNQSPFMLATSVCATGNSYTPNFGDGRAFVVAFRSENMAAYEPLPAQSVNFAPMAIQAKYIGGFGPTNLLRLDNGAAASNLTPFNSAQFTSLQNLVNGTSSQYLQASSAAGAVFPVVLGAPLTPSTGSVWYNSVTNSLQFYNGTTSQTLSTSTGGVATSFSGILPLANGGTGSANGSVTGTGALALAAGGSNQNVTLTPSGTGFTLLNGSVGVGTAAPMSALDVSGGVAIGAYAGTAAAPANDLIVSGAVGIGTSLPTNSASLNVNTSVSTGIVYGGLFNTASTDQTATAAAGVRASFAPVLTTAATSGTYNYYGLQVLNTPTVQTGISNSGVTEGISILSLRNRSGVSTDDNGSLASLYGVNIVYGNNNTVATLTPQTTNAYGVFISPYYRTGTIGNMYDLYIDNGAGGGTITGSHYGIYQNDPTVKNWLGGAVGVGANNSSPGVQLDVHGTVGSPALSGATQLGVLRVANITNNYSLDMGNYASAPYGSWLQSTNRSNLAINSPLVLNPNGGNIGIGTATPNFNLEIAGTANVSSTLSARHVTGIAGSFTTAPVWGTGAGTAPTSTSVTGSDVAQKIVFVASSGTTASTAIVTVTFNSSFGSAPVCTFSPGTSAAAALSGTSSVYITTSAAGYTLMSGSTALGASAFVFYVHCLQ